jgi:hypothetical protein
VGAFVGSPEGTEGTGVGCAVGIASVYFHVALELKRIALLSSSNTATKMPAGLRRDPTFSEGNTNKLEPG